MGDAMCSGRKNGPRGWWGAVARGLAACILSNLILCVVAGLVLPGAVDGDNPRASTLIGIGVWSLSLAFGGCEALPLS